MLLRQTSRLALLSTLLVIFCSCGSSGLFRTMFTGVSLADAEFIGIKSGNTVQAASAINPDVATLSGILSALGQTDPLAQYLGVLMPLSVLGETSPRWVLCTDEYVAKCNSLPINARVQFSGKPIGPGLIWKPTRLTSPDFND